MIAPGSTLTHRALLEVFEQLRLGSGNTFLDAGCGDGWMTRNLVNLGLTGTAVEPSPAAFPLASATLKAAIESQRCNLVSSRLESLQLDHQVDVAIALTVIEDLDDISFLKALRSHMRPSGFVIITVPAHLRRGGLTYEDVLVGHLRRYRHELLEKTLQDAGLQLVFPIKSLGVPYMNITEPVKNIVLRLRRISASSASPSNLSPTDLSGVHDDNWINRIPDATPRFVVKPLLNAFHIMQRWFYPTRFGRVLLAVAEFRG